MHYSFSNTSEITNFLSKMSLKINSNNNLIQILATFTRLERKQFYDFLASPFFNKRNDVRRLYQILEKRNDLTKSISKERVIRKLFPDSYSKNETPIKETDFPRLRNTMSVLSKLMEKFLLQLAHEDRTLENHRLLVDEMMKRKLYSQSRSITKKGLKLHSTEKIKRSAYYDEYRLKEAEFYLNVFEKSYSLNLGISPVILPFQHYYLSNILAYCCGEYNQARILKKEVQFPYLNNLLLFLDGFEGQMPLLIEIYYNILLFLRDKHAVSSYERVKTLYEECKERLEKTEQRQILNFMLNFCARKIREGNSKYLEERFELYDKNLSSGTWNNGLYFSKQHFYLHVMNSIRLGKLHKVHTFINDYSSLLPPDDQETMLGLCHALLMFAKKKYQLSLKSLNSIPSKGDFFYFLYVKALFIKLYFELEQHDELHKVLEALRHFLRENRSKEIADNIRTAHKEFHSFAKNITKFRGHPNERKKFEKLKSQLLKTEVIVERDWLLSKLE